MKKDKTKIKKEIEISLRCDCGDRKYLTFWKDEHFLPGKWCVSICKHWVPLISRIKEALMLVFCPYNLGEWEEFILDDKIIKQLAKKINKFYEISSTKK